MRIFFVIAARGGSQGIPRKNIIQLGKYPLIAYKIIAAQKCKYEKRIIVSTDDEEIADVARKYGAEVPFMRPAKLASNTASSISVVDHAVEWIRENDLEKYDCVCLLEPSSPFLSYIDIDNAFELFAEKNADTILGMKESEVAREFIYPLDGKGGLSLFYHSLNKMKSVRRQDQPVEYTMNGCLYAARWEYYLEHHEFHSENSVPYVMSSERSVEIDTPFDLLLAKMIVENHLIDLSPWDSAMEDK